MSIIAFSGKKQSGKSTSANFLAGKYLVERGVLNNFSIREDGTLFTQLDEENIVDINLSDPADQSSQLWSFVKIYSFGDLLKQTCMMLFGLTYEQVYGSDENKNTLSQIKWEDFPLYTRDECVNKFIQIQSSPRKTGYMTAREILQYFGSEICRKMYQNVWSDALIRLIQAEQPELALITDVRFPNEVEAVENAGGTVIRLLRNPFDDQHVSETSLDNHQFKYTIDNTNCSIQEQNDKLVEIISSL